MAQLATRVKAQLESLGEGFAQPCVSEAAGRELLAKAEAVEQLFVLAAAAGRASRLSSAQQASMVRQAHALLERIAALNAPLQSLVPGRQAAVLQLAAACHVAARCARLHDMLGLPAAGPPERLRQAAIRLPLQCGRLALEAFAALPPGAQLPQQAEVLLMRQLEAVEALEPSLSGAAATAAEGRLAAAWLGVVAAAFARMAPATRLLALRPFSQLCTQAILTVPQLAAFRSALQQSPQALEAILAALLADVPALAPALLEPRAGSEQPIFSSDLDAQSAQSVVTLLGSELLRPALQAALSAPGASGAEAACVLVLRAAKLAVGLAARLPSSGPVEFMQLVPPNQAMRFLGTACSQLADAEPQRRLSVQQQRRLAADLLPTLPAFLAVMRAQQRVAGDPGQGLPAAVLQQLVAPEHIQEEGVRARALTCGHFYGAVALLVRLCSPVAGSYSNTTPHPITASLEDVAAWAAAAGCALQALPLAAEVAPLLAASSNARLRLQLSQLPPNLAREIDVLCRTTCVFSSGFVLPLRDASTASLPTAAELARTLRALWQLHSAACRWVHWVAANPAAAAALWPPSGPGVVPLLAALRHSFVAAHEAWAALRRRLGDEPPRQGGSRCDEHDRCMMAVQAAHFEALVAAVRGAPDSAWDFDCPSYRPRADTSGAGYAADLWEFSFQRVADSRLLRWSPSLQATVLLAIQRLPQERDRRHRICNNVLLQAATSPRLGAALLAAGFGEQVLADCAAGGPLEPQADRFESMVATTLRVVWEEAEAAVRSTHGGAAEREVAAASAVRRQMEAVESVRAGAAEPSSISQLLHILASRRSLQQQGLLQASDDAATRKEARAALARLLPEARSLAAVLVQQWWVLPSQAAADEAAELARAAADRSCANLRCPRLVAEGGPAVRQGAGNKKCSGCKVARYCDAACQHADWRQGGHKLFCPVLAAGRQE